MPGQIVHGERQAETGGWQRKAEEDDVEESGLDRARQSAADQRRRENGEPATPKRGHDASADPGAPRSEGGQR